MPRPYQRMSFCDLELLFTSAADDLGKLKEIQAELQQRSVPTALRLLEKIQLQMKRLAPHAPSLNAKTADLAMPSTAPSDVSLNASLPRQAGLGHARVE